MVARVRLAMPKVPSVRRHFFVHVYHELSIITETSDCNLPFLDNFAYSVIAIFAECGWDITSKAIGNSESSYVSLKSMGLLRYSILKYIW